MAIPPCCMLPVSDRSGDGTLWREAAVCWSVYSVRPLSTAYPYLAPKPTELFREPFASGVVLPFSILFRGTGRPHGRSCDRSGGDHGTLQFARSRSAAAGLV